MGTLFVNNQHTSTKDKVKDKREYKVYLSIETQLIPLLSLWRRVTFNIEIELPKMVQDCNTVAAVVYQPALKPKPPTAVATP